jgi:hypothetical protein
MQRVPDSDNGTIGAREMLAELLADNQSPVADLRGAHTLCDEQSRCRLSQPDRELDRRG